MIDSEIIVSACIITYNHEKYIGDCIEGALKQDINYKYEIVIGDDNSTDATATICQEYANQYPDIIRFIKRGKNLGMNGNWSDTMMSCGGKYIALCEGDDLWSDKSKLQQQVDFLEKNQSYSSCYHGANVINEHGGLIKDTKWPVYRNHSKEDLLFVQGEMITCTVTFRNLVYTKIKLFKGTNLDTYLWHLLGFYGGAKFIGSIKYSSYRIHSGGVWSVKNDYYKLLKGLYTYDCIADSLLIDGYELKTLHKISSKVLNVYMMRQLKARKIILYVKGFFLIFRHKSLDLVFFLKCHLRAVYKKIN